MVGELRVLSRAEVPAVIVPKRAGDIPMARIERREPIAGAVTASTVGCVTRAR